WWKSGGRVPPGPAAWWRGDDVRMVQSRERPEARRLQVYRRGYSSTRHKSCTRPHESLLVHFSRQILKGGLKKQDYSVNGALIPHRYHGDRPGQGPQIYQTLTFEARQKAGRVPARSAHLLDFRVEGIHEACDRQARAVVAGLGNADRKVLAHPFDREAEIKFAFAHRPGAVLHLPGLRGALRDH